MKFVDFTSLLDTEPANLAALSTFQFDADFFERRLLRCSALVKARRILVFMDAGQWFKLLRQDVPARFLNRRYLVVPVRPPKGVFHPKLNLLVREDGGQIQCGSNNLTRSGCASQGPLPGLLLKYRRLRHAPCNSFTPTAGACGTDSQTCSTAQPRNDFLSFLPSSIKTPSCFTGFVSVGPDARSR